jgi:purine-binding chemotaxis protein CheW
MGLEDDVFTNTSRIIILKLEEKGLLGMIVDQVCEVVNLTEDQIDTNHMNTGRMKDTFINGIGTSGDQLISLFEINSIIDEKDNA